MYKKEKTTREAKRRRARKRHGEPTSDLVSIIDSW